ncbi:RAI1 like PD-XK nuclease-domain-containing protein [Sporodiniella umbellata]|nr:RAI1 like PD-XK nuclease-domain-containing protein [Sporodiniella umbellata]
MEMAVMFKRKSTDFSNEAPAGKRASPLASFSLQPNQRYTGSFPVYKQPQELTCYSIDRNRHVWFDSREMKYYYPPTGKDLTVGYNAFIQRDETMPEHLDTLLDALTEWKSRETLSTQADIVTWRGILTKLLCTPFSRKDRWELRATRYNGTLYIEERSLKEEKTESDRMKQMCYWGYRFETMSTISELPGQVKKATLEQRNQESANTNVQYCVVVKTKLGQNSIIMGAEVDCCRDKKPEDPYRQMSNYVELKTSRILQNQRNEYSFKRYKLLKFWAQSFLVGIPRVICGFRDDEGQIMEVKEIKTLEIPRQVRDKPEMWDPAVCLNFANQLLDWIQKTITTDDATTTFSIEFKPHLERIDVSCTGHEDVFLTQRFLDGTTQQEIGGERATRAKKRRTQ